MVRLAHLVPDKIVCDMYIQLQSVTGPVLHPFKGIDYGRISDYVPVKPGTYSVTMRAPGAATDSPPVLSTSITVQEGKYYTVARIGTPEKSEAQVINDDHSKPAAGSAKVRVLQTSQRTLDVSVGDSAQIAKGVPIGKATDYQQVSAGSHTVKVQPAGAQAVTAQTQLAAGAIYSLLVKQTDTGTLVVDVKTDAAGGGGAAPNGGVQAGGGQSGSTLPWAGLPLLALGLLVLGVAAVTGGLTLLPAGSGWVRRRRTPDRVA